MRRCLALVQILGFHSCVCVVGRGHSDFGLDVVSCKFEEFTHDGCNFRRHAEGLDVEYGKMGHDSIETGCHVIVEADERLSSDNCNSCLGDIY